MYIKKRKISSKVVYNIFTDYYYYYYSIFFAYGQSNEKLLCFKFWWISVSNSHSGLNYLPGFIRCGGNNRLVFRLCCTSLLKFISCLQTGLYAVRLKMMIKFKSVHKFFCKKYKNKQPTVVVTVGESRKGKTPQMKTFDYKGPLRELDWANPTIFVIKNARN